MNIGIEYNIYCDESCHLERDHQTVMLIGGIWCPISEVEVISQEVRELKRKHSARGELKWTKVSLSRRDFYIELTEYFFGRKGLNFRCLVVSDKSKLDHDYFNQGSHDSFYYKMYFYMLRNVLKPQCRYNIYLDIKDTKSTEKVRKLRDVLCHDFYDFTGEMISTTQQIRSRESDLVQLADFLIGAVGYENRDLSGNKAKVEVARKLRELSGCSLTSSSPPWEEKFNIFIFEPRSKKE